MFTIRENPEFYFINPALLSMDFFPNHQLEIDLESMDKNDLQNCS